MWPWLEGVLLTPDPEQARALLLIGAVGIGAVILLMGATLVGIGQRRAARRADDGFDRRRFSRIAARRGLDSADAAVLERLARRHGVADPTRLFTDRRLLADLLARAVYAVERRPDLPDHDRQLWLARYYRLRERMERDAAADPQRSHRRRLLERPCIVTPIRIVARRQVPAADAPALPPAATLAAERRTMAAVMDVSTGGCAVRSLGRFESGRLAKIEFELDGHSQVAAIGRIRQVRPQRPGGSIVHVQFTKLSREHRNRIHRFVYNGQDARTTDEPSGSPRP